MQRTKTQGRFRRRTDGAAHVLQDRIHQVNQGQAVVRMRCHDLAHNEIHNDWCVPLLLVREHGQTGKPWVDNGMVLFCFVGWEGEMGWGEEQGSCECERREDWLWPERPAFCSTPVDNGLAVESEFGQTTAVLAPEGLLWVPVEVHGLMQEGGNGREVSPGERRRKPECCRRFVWSNAEPT